MKTFVGLNGKISADEKNIILTRDSGIAVIFQKEGDLIIPICNILKIVYSEGGFTNGYISFLRNGDRKPHSIFSAVKNETTIIFRCTKNRMAQEMVEYVNSLILR